MQLKIGIVQTSISRNIKINRENIIKFILQSEQVDLLLFPEGMISGYYPENSGYLRKLKRNQLDIAIEEIKNTVQKKQIEVIIPTALYEKRKWFNASLWFSKNGQIKHIYKKCNLSNLDRNHFSAGDKLEVCNLREAKIAIQMCREIKYPEQWLFLKTQGAHIIFHLNNNQSNDSYWENLYRTRAYENQIYIISVNPTHQNQKLFSYVISPKGQIILQTEATERIYYISIDLSLVKNDFIKQRRSDLIDVTYQKNCGDGGI